MSTPELESQFMDVAVGFAFTVLLHTALFWFVGFVLADTGVLETRLRWPSAGIMSVCYVISKAWMASLYQIQGR